MAAVQRGVTSYYTINTLTPDTYGYGQAGAAMAASSGGWGGAAGDDVTPSPPTLTVVSYTSTVTMFNPAVRFVPTTGVSTYTLNDTSLGPLDPATASPDSLRAFFHTLQSMTVSYPPLASFSFGSTFRNCFLWSLAVHYDFTNRGQIHVTMDQEIVGSCDVYATSGDALADKALWLNLAVVGLSILHSLLILKAVVRSLMLWGRLEGWAQTEAVKLRRAARVLERRKAELLGVDAGAMAAGGASGGRGPGGPASPDLGLQSVGVRMGPLKSGGAAGRGKGAGELGAALLGGQEGEDEIGERAASSAPSSTSAAAAAAAARRAGSVNVAFHSDLGVDGSGEVLVSVTQKKSAGGGAGGGAGAGPSRILLAPGGAGRSGGSSSSSSSTTDVDALISSLLAESGTGAGAAAAAGAASEALAAAADALDTSWGALPLRDRLRLVSGWAVLSLVADACNAASAALNLRDRSAHIPQDENRSLVMGIGVSFLWLGVLRYLEHNRDYFNVVLTIRRAGPRVLRFLVGVLPVFIAYVLFAVVVFSDRIPRFADFRTAAITLFANLNGDVVRETFMAMIGYHPVVAQFFFYSFISLHIYVILNVVVAVVEESYFLTVEKTSDYAAKLAEEGDGGEEDGDEEGGEEGGEGGSGPRPPPSGGILPLLVASAAEGARKEGAAAGAAGAAGAGGGVGGAAATQDLLATPAKSDSHSVKERPDSKLAVLLRLSEWDEVAKGLGGGGEGGR